MGLRVKEEALNLASLVGENSTQTIVQDSVEIPSIQGDIRRVVWLKGTAEVENVSAVEDRVVIDGKIDLKMVYEEEDGENPQLTTVNWDGEISFHHFVEIIGVEPGMEVEGEAQVLSVDYDLSNDRRSLDVDVLLGLGARARQTSRRRVVTGASVEPPKKLSVKDIPVQNRVLIKSAAAGETVSDDLELAFDEEKTIAKVLDLELTPQVLETKANGGTTAQVSGRFDVDAIFSFQDGTIGHQVWEGKLPFNIEVPCDVDLSNVNLRGEIQAEPRVEVKEKALKVTVDVAASVFVSKMTETRLVVELSSASGDTIEVRKEAIRLDNLINEKTQQSSAQGVIELDEEFPPIREVLRPKAVPHISEYRVDEDKVFIDGTIDLELTYLAYTEDENRPLYHAVLKNALTFQQVVAIGGVEPGMLAHPKVTAKEISIDLINRETMEVEVVVRAATTVVQSLEEEVVVEALEVGEPEEDPPSITYVILQPNDTLWKLSRRYHTSLEAIYAANSWLREHGEEQLQPGDKLCIPRRQ